MKKLTYTIAFAVVMVSCGAPAEEQTTASDKDTTTQPAVVEEAPEVVNSIVLESGSMGIFKIGQPMPALPEVLNSRKSIVTKTDANGVTAEHVQHIIFNTIEDIAEITMEHNPNIAEEDLVIVEMRSITGYYETKDGIKQGTTLTELMEKYPDTQIKYVGATGDIVAENPAFESVHFVIDPAACTKALKGTKDVTLTAKNFSEEAKIATIKVY